MKKTLIAFALVLSLGACSKNASDQPENSTANAPATAAPYDSTAQQTPPTGNDSANTTATTPTDSSMMNESTTGDSTATGDASAMGGTSTATSINLDEELRRCDQLSGAERDTCRSDAQARADQQNTATPTTP
jgi:hypothetical protein